ncbi:hypothetical protein ABNX05_18255 [Lysinibacillus sp. M3]|uniref:Uncharacterized protein n=1 Tax=Lysinibacillus zambalensis TaxID=3160866 RepID=A0ABV1MWP7_9BACI
MKLVDVTDPISGTTTQEMQEVPVLDADGKQVYEDVEKPVLDNGGKPVMEKHPIIGKVQEEVLLAELDNIYHKFPSEFPIKRTFTALEFGDITKKNASVVNPRC